MAKGFSKQNSHEENVKVSIDSILGVDTTIKRGRRTAEDHRRALFNQFIDGMLFCTHRSGELDSHFFMDMTKYDTIFYETIETVMKLVFTTKQIDMIYFFLYERVDLEGKVIDIYDEETKEPIKMNTPEQLWESIKKYH